MDKWRLSTVQASQVECRSCGRRVVTQEAAPQKATAIFKTQGWQLRAGGAMCPQCIMEDEDDGDTGDYHK
jgi:hypothetical protein